MCPYREQRLCPLFDLAHLLGGVFIRLEGHNVNLPWTSFEYSILSLTRVAFPSASKPGRYLSHLTYGAHPRLADHHAQHPELQLFSDFHLSVEHGKAPRNHSSIDMEERKQVIFCQHLRVTMNWPNMTCSSNNIFREGSRRQPRNQMRGFVTSCSTTTATPLLFNLRLRAHTHLLPTKQCLHPVAESSDSLHPRLERLVGIY